MIEYLNLNVISGYMNFLDITFQLFALKNKKEERGRDRNGKEKRKRGKNKRRKGKEKKNGKRKERKSLLSN